MDEDSMCESLMEFNLFDVAKNENFDVLKLVLNNMNLYPFDLDSKDKEGNTLLHILVGKSNLELTKNLLKFGAPTNILNNKDETPLHFATSTEMAQLLIDSGAKLEFPDSHNETVIFRAVRLKNFKLLRFYYKNGASLERINYKGQTLLHLAKTVPIVDYLIKQGMDVNAKCFSGETPVQRAVLSGDVEVLELLLNCGGNIEELDCHHRSLLHLAVLQGSLEIVDVLLKRGININAVNTEGCSPLHWAVDLNRIEIIKLFMSYKIDINLKDKDDYTPLHIAAIKADVDILKLLIKNGANFELQTFNGDLPLHLAVLTANIPAIFALYDDAHLEIKNKDNLTPMDLAAESNKNIGELILALGRGNHWYFM